MGKNNSSQSDDHFSDSDNRIGDVDVPDVASSQGQVTLIFRQRRRYELHIGRVVYVFGPNEAKSVPASVINHPDFTSSVRNNFTIKGV